LRLYESEIKNVEQFALKFKLADYKNIILVECGAQSGQSFFNLELAMNVAQYLIDTREDIIVIISSHIKIDVESKRIIDASILTYRENAELSKYCTLLVGCSSGITWLLTSDWAKKIPTVQFLKEDTIGFQFASVKYDFEYWNLDTSGIIESSQSEAGKAAKIVLNAIENFTKARELYHEEFKPAIISLERKISFRNFIKTMRMIYYFISRNNNKFSNLYNITIYIFKNIFLKVKTRVFKDWNRV
jgi:hypothetical protein